MAADRLVVNTSNLGEYSGRISTVIGRIHTLQSRICTLYRTGEVSGLYYFYRYNRFYSGTQTLGRCQNYIANTVSDLEIVERFYSEVDPLNFVAPRGVLISALNSSDNTSGWRRNIRNLFTYLSDKVGAVLYDGMQLRDLIAVLETGDGATINEAIQKVLLEATNAEACGSGNSKDSLDESSLFEKILGNISDAAKTGGKLFSDDDISAFGTLAGFARDIYTLATGERVPSETYKNTLSALKSAISSESSLSKIISKSLHGESRVILSEKMAALGVFGNAISFSKDTVNLVDVAQKYANGEAAGYEVAVSGIDTANSAVQFGGSAYTLWNYTVPGLQMTKDGNFYTGVVKNPKIKNVSQNLVAVSCLFDMASGAVKSYGEVSADGTVDLEDAAEIMMDSAFSGLHSLPVLNLVPDEYVEVASDAVLEYSAQWGKDTAQYISEHENLQDCMDNGPWYLRIPVFFGSAILEKVGYDM